VSAKKPEKRSRYLHVPMGWAMPFIVLPFAWLGSVMDSVPDDDAHRGVAHPGTLWGLVVGLVVWCVLFEAIRWSLDRTPAVKAPSGEQQHRRALPVTPEQRSEQRDRNRAWVRHARSHGASHVTIWFARGEYDDATRIEVSTREALRTLAEHVTDFHVDAVGTCDGRDVTVYLSEYVETEPAA
jgi:phenylpyruvate tautomerase PptA (4-oxalocrotonate tautomerase family)